MSQKEKFAEKALDYFKSGYHCSESVLLALVEYLDVKSSLFPRIATGFHGGFGASGLICGAISGATMGLSLKFGRDNLDAGPWTAKDSVQELVNSFKKEVGTIYCSEITETDLNDQAQVKEFIATRRIPVCGEKVVRFAVRKAIEIIERGPTSPGKQMPPLTAK